MSFRFFITAFSTKEGSFGAANAFLSLGMKCLSSSTCSAEFTSSLFAAAFTSSFFVVGKGGGERLRITQSGSGGGGDIVRLGRDPVGGGDMARLGSDEAGGGGGDRDFNVEGGGGDRDFDWWSCGGDCGAMAGEDT